MFNARNCDKEGSFEIFGNYAIVLSVTTSCSEDDSTTLNRVHECHCVIPSFEVQCRSIRKPSIQSEFVHLYQCLSYVYPDLHLYSALSQLSVAYLENEIALTVKKRFLSCWSLTYLPENPPNGEYFSEDDDTILINACYSNPLWVSRVPKAPLSFETCLGEWLSVRTDRDNTFFSSVIHFSKDNMPICIFESSKQVLYWTCPRCSAKNTTTGACSACGDPIPEAVKTEGLIRMKYAYPSLFVNYYYMTQSADPVVYS